MVNKDKLLEVSDLSIWIDKKLIVDRISFTLDEGEIVGIVGESGSGKTMTALSIMDLLHKNAKVTGSINYNGIELTKLSSNEYRKLKGKELAMVFQEPMTSFNPLLTIGQQMSEVYDIHSIEITDPTKIKHINVKDKILDALRNVELEDVENICDKYPHELSGGMRQRVMIAMAMLLKPKILIADEPTTALDVTVQKKILNLMKDLNKKYGTSILLISHDLGVINSICDNVIVMQGGSLVEKGSSKALLSNPREAYTKKLLEAIPKRDKKVTKTIDTINSNVVLKVEALNVFYENKSKGFIDKKSKKLIVKNVNLSVYEGETLGIVGESGSGKSTLAKAIVGLNRLYEGKLELLYDRPQMVFQDPYSSLNPTKRVGKILEEPLILSRLKNKEARYKKVTSILKEIGLDESYKSRYIHELSGGQRQRVAIGLALIQEAKFVVLDEPVSALDVTVQAQVLELLVRLQIKYKLTYVFISHDLNIVYQLCNRVCVMYQGNIIEYGDTEDIYINPKEEYTKQLLDAILTIE